MQLVKITSCWSRVGPYSNMSLRERYVKNGQEALWREGGRRGWFRSLFWGISKRQYFEEFSLAPLCFSTMGLSDFLSGKEWGVGTVEVGGAVMGQQDMFKPCCRLSGSGEEIWGPRVLLLLKSICFQSWHLQRMSLPQNDLLLFDSVPWEVSRLSLLTVC